MQPRTPSARLQDKSMKIILDQEAPQESPWPSRRTDLRRGLMFSSHRMHGAQARAPESAEKAKNQRFFNRFMLT